MIASTRCQLHLTISRGHIQTAILLLLLLPTFLSFHRGLSSTSASNRNVWGKRPLCGKKPEKSKASSAQGRITEQVKRSWEVHKPTNRHISQLKNTQNPLQLIKCFLSPTNLSIHLNPMLHNLLPHHHLATHIAGWFTEGALCAPAQAFLSAKRRR